MREFSKVSPNVWASQKFRKLTTSEERLLYLYLLTCPDSNAIGCFRLAIGNATDHLRINEKQYRKAIDTLCSVGLIMVDRAEEVILIRNWFSFNEPSNPKHAMGLLGEFKRIASRKLGAQCFRDFMAVAAEKNFAAYDNFKALCDRVSILFGEGIATETEMERETSSHAALRSIDEVKPKKGEDPPGFEKFWATYPTRAGSQDRKAAVKAFPAAVERAGGLETVLWGADRYRVEMLSKGKIGTEYVKQARTWLNADGWKEYGNGSGQRTVDAEPTVKQFEVILDSPQWQAWEKYRGKKLPQTDLRLASGEIGRGWYVPTEWPPGHQPAS